MSNQQQSASVSSIRLVVVTLISFAVYRVSVILQLPLPVGWLFLGIFWIGVAKTTLSLFKDWRWHQFFKSTGEPTGIYGSTDLVGINDLISAGLKTDNNDGNGIPLGAIGGNFLFFHGSSHLSFRASTGGGKTDSSFAPICFALGKHRNIIATGKGKEPACLIAAHRKSIGQEVRVIDIGNQMQGTGIETSVFNPVGHLQEFRVKVMI